MNYKSTYLILGLALLTLLGCEDAFETTLEIDPPPHTPRLSINAFGSTKTNALRVYVTKTVGILENANRSSVLINDATVSLYKDDNLLYTLPLALEDSPFNYNMEPGNVIFEKGSTYTLEVTAPGFPMVSSTAIVPEDVPLNKIEFEENGPNTDFDDESSEIEITFQDPLDIDNYYEVSGAIINLDTFTERDFWPLDTDSFDPAPIQGIDRRSLIFDDTSFDGENKTLSFTILPLTRQDADAILYFLWRTTSKEHFLYNKTTAKHDEQDGNPFASPVQIFSNMEGGIGIFSIVNEQVVKVIE